MQRDLADWEIYEKIEETDFFKNIMGFRNEVR
jgi:hypothetical protein